MPGSVGTNKHASRLEAIFNDKSRCARLLEQTGDDAQSVLDSLQLLIDCPGISTSKSPQSLKSRVCSTMIRLSRNSGMYPQCLHIENVQQIGEHPVAGGGFGDVWKGSLGGRRLVCLKVIRTYEATDVGRIVREYTREAILWRQLKHRNVLPFLGLYYLDKNKRRLCLVSPWMENGNLVQYLKKQKKNGGGGKSNRIKILLAYDVASGLSHLHEKKIVHGNLKGVNIMITPEGRACITDFGLSRVTDSTSLISNQSSHSGGTVRWLAPELLMGGRRTSRESDMYAFGCLCYEIFTGHIPFHDLPNDAAVLLHVLVGKRPQIQAQCDDVPEGVCSLMESCWQSEPLARSSADAAVEVFVSLQGTIAGIVPAQEWDEGVWDAIAVPCNEGQIEGALEMLEASTEVHLGTGVGSYWDDPDLDSSMNESDANEYSWLPNLNQQPQDNQLSLSPLPIASPSLSFLTLSLSENSSPSPSYTQLNADNLNYNSSAPHGTYRLDTWDNGADDPLWQGSETAGEYATVRSPWFPQGQAGWDHSQYHVPPSPQQTSMTSVTNTSSLFTPPYEQISHGQGSMDWDWDWDGSIDDHGDTHTRAPSRADTWDGINDTPGLWPEVRPRTPSLIYSSPSSSSSSGIDMTPPATPSIAAREFEEGNAGTNLKKLSRDAAPFVPRPASSTPPPIRARTARKISIKKPDGSEVDLKGLARERSHGVSAPTRKKVSVRIQCPVTGRVVKRIGTS